MQLGLLWWQFYDLEMTCKLKLEESRRVEFSKHVSWVRAEMSEGFHSFLRTSWTFNL